LPASRFSFEGRRGDAAFAVVALFPVALLLDAHAFLWWVDDSPRLSKRARRAIGRPDETWYVSVTSCWEMAIKVSLGRLTLAQRLDRFVAEQMAANGLRPLGVQLDHAALRYGVKRVW
jgi:PIN domain nuclease of toxin-antitoxin system